MGDNFLNRQKLYWNTLAKLIEDDVAVNHWVDEKGKPVSLKVFQETAIFLKDKFLKNKLNGNILDIGCGNGLVLRELLKILGNKWSFHGSDISEEMISKVKLDNVILYLTDGSHIPCEELKFDLVYLNSVVQYFDNEDYLRSVMLECLRILKPGGGLCLLDVPLNLYQEYMIKNDIITKLKRRIISIAEKHFKQLLRIYWDHRNRTTTTEVINKVKVPIPRFKGFYADPDFFYEYMPFFEQISIEMQPFQSKPLIYRKFRFNILMIGKEV